METRAAILADIHRLRALLADGAERTGRISAADAKRIAEEFATIEAELDRIVADLADDETGD